MKYNNLCDEHQDYNTLVGEINDVKFFDSPETDFNFIHINVRSIYKNFLNVVSYLEYLGKSFDVIALSETNVIHNVCDFQLRGYSLCYNESKINKCDGFIFYVRTDLLTNMEIIQINSSKFLIVYIKKCDKLLTVLGTYRCHDIKIPDFIGDVEKLLCQVKLGRSITVFSGDININLLSKNCKNVQRYLNCLSESGLESMINKVTRVAGDNGSCLDHIFVKPSGGQRENIKAMILRGSHSDHSPTLLNICLTAKTGQENYKFIKKFDEQKMIAYLSEESWDSILNENDVNFCAAKFVRILKEYIERSTTTKYVKCKNRIKQPWMTSELLKCIRERDRLKKISSLQPNNVGLKNNFINYRKNVTKLLHKAKAEYYKEMFGNNMDTKRTWELIKKSTNDVKVKTKISRIITEDNVELDSDRDISEEFNRYFSEIGKKLAKNMKSINQTDHPNQAHHVAESFFLQPVSENEIIEIIASLKNGCSHIGDGISNNILKITHQFLIKPFKYLINLIFSKGFYPDCFKNAVIIPLHKAGSRYMVSNYRPISLINNLNKVIEKCIKRRLCHFLNEKNLLSNKQFAYKQGYSTEDALISVTDLVVTGLSNSEKSIAIFLDLAKAFDTVSHRILIEKLEWKGVRGLPLDLFKSYLNNRKQSVKVGEIQSSSREVESGVPQGTVLGPLLFSVYIDGLLSLLPDADVISYADDTVIIVKDKKWTETFKKAEKALCRIKSWLDTNLLSLNIDKTNFICFSLTKASAPVENTITIHKNNCNNQTCNCELNIKSVTNTKYLGVYIDQHLKWDFHVEYVTKKIRKLFYKFYILRQYLPRSTLLNIYKALAESVLNYGICVWGATYESVLTSLMIAQKTILKICMFKSRMYPTQILFTEAKVLTLRKLYVKAVVRILTKNKITKQKIDHAFKTRQKVNNCLVVPFTEFTAVCHSLHYMGPKIFNLLPLEFRMKKYQSIKQKLLPWLHTLDTNLLF